MKRRHRVPKIRPKRQGKAIKFESDLQLNWLKLVPRVKNYRIQSVNFLTIAGDAPKDFTTDKEYRPGHRSRTNPYDKFIAKVGSKFYPLESITEQLITRIGQSFGLKIADSKLRIINGQVRFLSRYFLKGGEQLTHGAEIYEYSLGKENYQELSDRKREAEYFTFQMTRETIHQLFPSEGVGIVGLYIEMLAFDALIGHNDRHPYNWGVIVPIRKKSKPRFAPVFDTARALYWNIPESKIVIMNKDEAAFDAYIRKCSPPVGWDRAKNVAFFDLIGLIWNDFPEYRKHIDKFLDQRKMDDVEAIITKEFRTLISEDRCELIKKCLHRRQKLLIEAISICKGE